MKFFTSNETKWRLLRTIVQGVLGVIVANLDVITGFIIIDPVWKPIVVAVVMAILSPLMAEIGGKDESQ